ncbi:MAG TPA: YraN family protein [Gammaproteobacteria bacterium]|nr:YraN family protein [Gammaproteobacteria bacterium]
MSLAPHLAAGREAEELALTTLEARGLKLLERNYRCPQGELDLVLCAGDTLVVAEVRYRREASRGSAAETVGPDKQRKLVLATQHFLRSHAELRRLGLRFDVVAVSGEPGRLAVEWIQDAFQAS